MKDHPLIKEIISDELIAAKKEAKEIITKFRSHIAENLEHVMLYETHIEDILKVVDSEESIMIHKVITNARRRL